ncbi:MAG: electron transfer flavoprotein subunit alpha/FixB family protein [Clostridia bacterium]|nr:electron transfer flavoprotein subunit alpha/FixB family protein [Clostridia bacterium]
MGIIIEQGLVNAQTAQTLVSLCPFGAISYENGELSVGMGCKSCKLCVNKGPQGVMRYQEEEKKEIDKGAWRGVCVFAERRGNSAHPVTMELLGKARELAAVTGHPVYALCIGQGLHDMAEELLHYGADKVFMYDDAAFADFCVGPYANAFCDFIQQVKPSSILVGATNLGRSLAPRVAAKCETGLTADCTMLQMKENTDLVQIRPAFGGNIMAQIVTPNTRPQFCTARYKVFSALPRAEKAEGEIVSMPVTAAMREGNTEVLATDAKPAQVDISEADVIVACGRGIKTQADLALAEELAKLLGAQMACTRPLIEAGWFDPRRQIGLSGRTVKPKLIICLGISGSVQFAAGMKGADCIIAINTDKNAAIFDIAHIGVVGDIYEILPLFIQNVKEGRHV